MRCGSTHPGQGYSRKMRGERKRDGRTRSEDGMGSVGSCGHSRWDVPPLAPQSGSRYASRRSSQPRPGTRPMGGTFALDTRSRRGTFPYHIGKRKVLLQCCQSQGQNQVLLLHLPELRLKIDNYLFISLLGHFLQVCCLISDL